MKVYNIYYNTYLTELIIIKGLLFWFIYMQNLCDFVILFDNFDNLLSLLYYTLWLTLKCKAIILLGFHCKERSLLFLIMSSLLFSEMIITCIFVENNVFFAIFVRSVQLIRK